MQHLTWEELTDYSDSRLPAERVAALEMHLALCSSCAGQVAWLQRATDLLRDDAFPAPTPAARRSADALFDSRMASAPVANPARPTPAPSVPRPVLTAERNAKRPPIAWWQRVAWVGAALAALLIVVYLTGLPAQGPLVAAVQDLHGQVEIIAPDGNSSLPSTGGTLREGSTIITGADGSAQLLFGDGAVRIVVGRESHIDYVGGTETEGALSALNLVTDTSGDLSIDAQPGVTVQLQTGVGQFSTTGGHFLFHYLEPRIVAVQVIRGTVTASTSRGVYDLTEGENRVLDYSQESGIAPADASRNAPPPDDPYSGAAQE